MAMKFIVEKSWRASKARRLECLDLAMMYATVHLRGKDREIRYRILGEGPGSGWEWDFEWTTADDRDDFPRDEALNDDEIEAINAAIIAAEGGR